MYRGLDRDTVEIMAGTIAPGFVYRPIANHGVEAQRPWLDDLPHLPMHKTFFAPGETITSLQPRE
jgi:hypothetical protein